MMKRAYTQDKQGTTPGQLGSMKPGSVEAIISSPPYADQNVGKGDAKNELRRITEKANKGIAMGRENQRIVRKGKLSPHEMAALDDYGQTPGNLGNLKPGEVAAVIGSPPFEGGVGSDKKSEQRNHYKDRKTSGGPLGQSLRGDYGNSEGQIGNDKGDTFWSAAKQIVAECHKILRPGGYAIWVVKSFVRKGAIVDFPGDWRRLCEAEGFETLHEHHAMLVKEEKAIGLFGQEIVSRIERKSFFRRLSDKNAAKNGYWDTLSRDEQAKWVRYAREKSLDWYASLTAAERAEYVIKGQPDSGPKYPKPCKASILADAKGYALDLDDVDPNEYNKHVRIDYETVFCMRKK